MLNLQLTVKG